jgi:hypothetical protein
MTERRIPTEADDSGSGPPRGTESTVESGKLATRRQREAEALRSNLRKRKDQARAREKPKQE